MKFTGSLRIGVTEAIVICLITLGIFAVGLAIVKLRITLSFVPVPTVFFFRVLSLVVRF